ncbi:MAG: ubiquinone biosynthesis protein UbiJ [Symbiopectobacterium sp.]
MLITSVLTAALETALNSPLFRERSLKVVRQQLQGKTLKIMLAELPVPLVLLFGEHHVDVVSHWADTADCQLETRIPVLLAFRDRRQLSLLMRRGELVIEGDMQVVQHFVNLLDLAEWCNPAEWLAPYTGDVFAQGIGQTVQGVFLGAARFFDRQRHYLAETVTEEWRLAPGRLEATWWYDEVATLSDDINTLAARLAKLESAV